ncbi:hypothetical protein DFQ28_007060 [Apophysomyces sp. BC1034]|nr:hypothetical protein DFQ29_005851 [Apophysomyces sp. BC1021]KAG0186970.1 hypothetical protein DFQ28_007060 [Apophysomyces sp. BC1034]
MTEEELKEVKAYKRQTVSPLPTDLALLFETYKDKHDYLKRVWLCVDKCFDSRGETASKATSERLNQNRAIPFITGMERKCISAKIDLLFHNWTYELGVAEAKKVDDIHETGCLLDGGLKCPKELKDMFLRLAALTPTRVNELRTCGFIFMGKYLNLSIMDYPKGYATCITKLNKPLPYLAVIEHLPRQLLPILHVIWHAQAVMMTTL